MAGSELAISPNTTDSTQSSQLSAVIEKWKVQYARFISISPSAIRSTHRFLTPTPINRFRGSWISSGSTVAKLIYKRPTTGFNDAVLVLSLGEEILEEHYISKMHFSWPQVSCMSGFPARGSRVVLVSYDDCLGQIQKFILRFLTSCEAEKFIYFVKELLGNGTPEPLQCFKFNSEMSSQAETIFSQGPPVYPDVECEHMKSEDNSTQLKLPSPGLTVADYSVSYEGVTDHEDAETMSVFPPSFSELMKNCHAATSGANPTEDGQDLKTQFVRYLEGTPFKELLDTVENVITHLGDDMEL